MKNYLTIKIWLKIAESNSELLLKYVFFVTASKNIDNLCNPDPVKVHFQLIYERLPCIQNGIKTGVNLEDLNTYIHV